MFAARSSFRPGPRNGRRRGVARRRGRCALRGLIFRIAVIGVIALGAIIFRRSAVRQRRRAQGAVTASTTRPSSRGRGRPASPVHRGAHAPRSCFVARLPGHATDVLAGATSTVVEQHLCRCLHCVRRRWPSYHGRGRRRLITSSIALARGLGRGRPKVTRASSATPDELDEAVEATSRQASGRAVDLGDDRGRRQRLAEEPPEPRGSRRAGGRRRASVAAAPRPRGRRRRRSATADAR